MSVPNPFPAAKTALDHVVIVVSDFERSNEFYRDVLGMTVVERASGYAYRLGDVQLNVHGPGAQRSPQAAAPVAAGGSDLCFRWDGTPEEAIAHLERKGVTIEDGPVMREGAAGAGTSIYFRDPDGSLLELISYREA